MISKSRAAARQHGFTLIEVLVALAIVVVSFVALYAVVLQMVKATTLMQEKTFATWVAHNRLTELRLEDSYPAAGNSEGEVEMAGSVWLYRTEVKSTESEDIRQVIVRVSTENEPDVFLGLITGIVVSPALGGGSSSTGNFQNQSGGGGNPQPGAAGFDSNGFPTEDFRELD
jgi:general secretion pathway protein I